MSHDRSDVLNRIQQLERDNRRWKLIVLGLFLTWTVLGGSAKAFAQQIIRAGSIGANSVTADEIRALRMIVGRDLEAVGPAKIQSDLIVGGSIQAGTITAKALIIKDSQGQILARLGGYDDAEGRLVVFGPGGKAELSTTPTGSALSLSAPEGPALTLVAEHSDDFAYAGLVLRDKMKKQRVTVALSGDNDSDIPRGLIEMTDGSSSFFSVRDSEPGTNLTLAGKEGSASLSTAGALRAGLRLVDGLRSTEIFAGFERPTMGLDGGKRKPVLRATDASHASIWEMGAGKRSSKN